MGNNINNLNPTKMKNTLTKTDKILLLSSIVCILLISTRIVYTGKITFIFLVWNLFLAGIPYLISRLIEIRNNTTKLQLVLATFFWLVFFPNAPYIITDFVHLTYNKTNLFWVDVSLIAIFSLTGLIYGISSLEIMFRKVKSITSQNIANLFYLTAIFLAGFGIYIGRILRWNSWDILSNPTKIINDLLHIFFNPIEQHQAWAISLGFSLMIYVSSKLIKTSY